MFDSYTQAGGFFKKALIVACVIVIAVGSIFYFLLNKLNPRTTKASQVTEIPLTFDPAYTSSSVDEEFTTTVKIGTVSQPLTAQGYVLGVVFDNQELQATKIEYLVGNTTEDLGDTTATLSAANTTGEMHLVAEVAAANPQILETGSELIKISFKVVNPDFTLSYIGIGGTMVQLQSDNSLKQTPITLTAYAVQDVSITGIPPSITPPPQDTNTTVTLKAKFQGITKAPAVNAQMPVAVKISGDSLTDAIYKVVLFSSDAQGIWTGTMNIDLPSPVSADDKFSLYVKGPYHLKKRICDLTPTETVPGSYDCVNDAVPLVVGENTVDMSSIVLLTGDLPVQDGTQDGVVNSADTSYVRLHLGDTSENVLTVADINLDGVVDSQDFLLIIGALSMKYDDVEE